MTTLFTPGVPAPLPRLIATASGKGGTGKSTLTLALAHVLAQDHGAPVAVLDLDPQASITEFAGLQPSDDPLHAEPQEAHGFVVYRAGRLLHEASDGALIAHVDRALASGRTVLADLAPALSDGGHRAILAHPDALLLLAVKLDAGGLRAARELSQMAEHHGLPFRIVPTFAKRWTIATTTLQNIRSFFGSVVTETAIPEDVKAAEAAAAELPLGRYAPKAKSAQAVRELAEELLGVRV